MHWWNTSKVILQSPKTTYIFNLTHICLEHIIASIKNKSTVMLFGYWAWYYYKLGLILLYLYGTITMCISDTKLHNAAGIGSWCSDIHGNATKSMLFKILFMTYFSDRAAFSFQDNIIILTLFHWIALFFILSC